MLLVTQISNLLGVKRAKEWSNKHKNTKHQLACIAASVISGGDFKGAIKPHCIDALKGTKYKGKVVLSGLPQKRKRGGNEEPAPEGAKNKQQTFNQYQKAVLIYRSVDQTITGLNGRADNYNRRDAKAFYKSLVNSLLREQLDKEGQKTYPSESMAIAAPAEVRSCMKKRAATFYTINLGFQWRKWLRTLDKTEATKERARQMLIEFYLPSAGPAKSTEAPWLAY